MLEPNKLCQQNTAWRNRICGKNSCHQVLDLVGSVPNVYVMSVIRPSRETLQVFRNFLTNGIAEKNGHFSCPFVGKWCLRRFSAWTNYRANVYRSSPNLKPAVCVFLLFIYRLTMTFMWDFLRATDILRTRISSVSFSFHFCVFTNHGVALFFEFTSERSLLT